MKTGDWNSFTMQDGTPATRTGSGGPNVSPLNVPTPVLTVVSQIGSRSSQPPRHICSVVPAGIGRLSDGPAHPLSRSVPSDLTMRTSSFGPSGFRGHAAGEGTLPAGRHTSIALSRSVRGVIEERAVTGR